MVVPVDGASVVGIESAALSVNSSSSTGTSGKDRQKCAGRMLNSSSSRITFAGKSRRNHEREKGRQVQR